MQESKRSWRGRLPLLLIPIIIAVAAVQLRARLTVPPVALAKPLPVRVVAVAPQRIEFSRPFTARIEDMERAAISARLSSVVDTIRVREGEAVRRGDELIILDDRDALAEVARAQALVRQARADLLFQQKQIKADRALQREGGISQQELDNAERKLEGLTAALAQHENSLKLSEQRLGYTRIKAPISGMVQAIRINEGEFAAAGRPVMEIVGEQAYKAVIILPEREMSAIRTGATVHIDLPDDRRWSGHIDKIYPALDAKTHTGTVEVHLDRPVSHQLFPGSTARAEIVMSSLESAIAVPAQALFTREGESGLFVEQEGRALWRPVEPGRTNGRLVVIRQGVQAGDRVIITAYPSLENGVAVIVAEVEPKP